MFILFTKEHFVTEDAKQKQKKNLQQNIVLCIGQPLFTSLFVVIVEDPKCCCCCWLLVATSVQFCFVHVILVINKVM